jgi:hypothetical protein
MESIKWDAPEFAGVEKSLFGNIGMIIVGILFLIFAFVQGNFLFFVFLLIAEGLLFFMGKRPANVHHYEFVAEGIMADKKTVYRLSEISKFSITDDGQSAYVELVLRHPKRFSQDVKLLMPRELADSVGELLSKYVKEFVYEETATEAFLKKFGL